ncbi:MAG TPA: antibiotic biosynthesis monooxygenase [Acidimicrobiales bacterium]|nr:antibiotic biosynthesis monooxygenase [Acidimicrobiales bacterium]
MDVFAAIANDVHAEPGCEFYALHKTGDRVVLVEKWTDDHALDVHRTAPSLLKLRAETADLVAEPWDIEFLTPLPLGDPAKGAL